MNVKRQKKNILNALTLAKNNNFSLVYKHNNYMTEKRKLVKILKCKKDNYKNSIIEKLSNCKQSAQFWKIVNTMRSKSFHKSEIDLPT